MRDYHVEWNIDIQDAPSPEEAANEAWQTMRRDDSIANSFVVSDAMDMTTVVDLHEHTVGDPFWLPGLGHIADLAEWMTDNDWSISEVIAMIRRPHKYADEFSKMKADHAFDAVAKEPEEAEELEDIPVSSVTVHFRPQAWLNDEAIEVDAEGDVRWIVSAETAKTIARQLTEHNKDFDFVRDDELAPDWIKNWSGPFTIEPITADHPFEEGVYHDECKHCGQAEEWHDVLL